MPRACIWGEIVCYRGEHFNKAPVQKGYLLQGLLPMQKNLRTSGPLPQSRTLFLRKHLGPGASACKGTVTDGRREPRCASRSGDSQGRPRRPRYGGAAHPPYPNRSQRRQPVGNGSCLPHGDSAFPRSPRCLRMAPSGSPKIRQSGDPKARRSKGRSNAWGGAGFMKLYR